MPPGAWLQACDPPIRQLLSPGMKRGACRSAMDLTLTQLDARRAASPDKSSLLVSFQSPEPPSLLEHGRAGGPSGKIGHWRGSRCQFYLPVCPRVRHNAGVATEEDWDSDVVSFRLDATP